MRRPRDDYNNGWQTVIRPMLGYLFALFFPDVHAAVDWDRPVEFLDREMAYAVRLAGKGAKAVDALVKVWLKSGDEVWMLLHLEFQNQVEATFSERMFGYNVLMYVRHHVKVASFAILGDTSPSWRPDRFEYEAFGSVTSIRYPIVKLLDYRDRIEELEQSDNPFALVVLAHLRAIGSSNNSERRRREKEDFTIRIIESGLPQETKVDMLRFLELVMPLPEDLEAEYRKAIGEYEREANVPVLTQLEKMAMREGRREALQETALSVLDAKFPRAPGSLRERLASIADPKKLRHLMVAMSTATSLADVEQAVKEQDV